MTSHSKLTPDTGSLWNLGGTLFELLEAREEALSVLNTARDWGGDFEASPVPAAEAELAAIEHGITQFVTQQLRDVDGLRGPLKALEQGVALNKADAAAATNRAMVLQNRYDRLKDLVKQCMIALDQAGEWKPKESRNFESARGSFTLRGNGGAQPVEIHDESLVPEDFKRVTITMKLNLWMERGCKAFAGCDVKVGAPEISKSAVAEALNTDCSRCYGNGVVEAWGNPDEDADYREGENPCKGCGGSGKQGVPGARLVPRGQSLIVK